MLSFSIQNPEFMKCICIYINITLVNDETLFAFH